MKNKLLQFLDRYIYWISMPITMAIFPFVLIWFVNRFPNPNSASIIAGICAFFGLVVIMFANIFIPDYISEKARISARQQHCKCDKWETNCKENIDPCDPIKLFDFRRGYEWQRGIISPDTVSLLIHWSGDAKVEQLEDGNWKWLIMKPFHYEVVERSDASGICATQEEAQTAAEKFYLENT